MKNDAEYVAGVWIWCWQQIQIREYGAGEYSAYFTPVTTPPPPNFFLHQFFFNVGNSMKREENMKFWKQNS